MPDPTGWDRSATSGKQVAPSSRASLFGVYSVLIRNLFGSDFRMFVRISSFFGIPRTLLGLEPGNRPVCVRRSSGRNRCPPSCSLADEGRQRSLPYHRRRAARDTHRCDPFLRAHVQPAPDILVTRSRSRFGAPRMASSGQGWDHHRRNPVSAWLRENRHRTNYESIPNKRRKNSTGRFASRPTNRGRTRLSAAHYGYAIPPNRRRAGSVPAWLNRRVRNAPRTGSGADNRDREE